MKISCILTAYNEIEYLPYKKKFCDYHNLELYVIDNYSNDGTWEWLQDNKIPSHRFDTQGMFVLQWLQKEILKTLKEFKDKPDWVIYNGVDLFPIALPNLHDRLVEIDSQGFNIASVPCIGTFNTGEDRSKNPFETFFYYSANAGAPRPLQMIYKYQPNVAYVADHIRLLNTPKKVTPLDGIMINYGQTKSFEEREETYLRRKKAWDAGIVNRTYGGHYRAGHDAQWIWPKESLKDLRKSSLYKYIEHLQDVCV